MWCSVDDDEDEQHDVPGINRKAKMDKQVTSCLVSVSVSLSVCLNSTQLKFIDKR